MANYTYRSVKGSPLTNAEIDGNFALASKNINGILYIPAETATISDENSDYRTIVVFGTFYVAPVITLPANKAGLYTIYNRTHEANPLVVYIKVAGQAGNVPIYPGIATNIIHTGTDAVNADSQTVSFPTGTRLVFSQSTAPFGWVLDSSMSDRMLRVVGDTSGNGQGGTDSPIVMNVVPSHTHTFTGSALPNHTHTFTGGALPNHTHTDSGHSHIIPTNQVLRVFDSNFNQLNTTVVSGALQSNSTLSGAASISSNSAGTPTGTNSATSAGTPTGSISTNSGAVNWSPKYLNVIVCTKQ